MQQELILALKSLKSNFALKSNLASLKAGVDKIDKSNWKLFLLI